MDTLGSIFNVSFDLATLGAIARGSVAPVRGATRYGTFTHYLQMKIFNSTTKFVGTLGIDEHRLDVRFEVRIDKAGEICIAIDEMERSDETKFVTQYADQPGNEFARFNLNGVADGGMRFSTACFQVTNVQRFFSEEMSTLTPEGVINHATLSYPLTEKSAGKFIRWNTKGFETRIKRLEAKISLGILRMIGATDGAPNEVSGYFEISQPPSNLSDWAAWSGDVDSLLTYIRHLFSFAASSPIRVPIIEHHDDNQVELIFFSQVEISGQSPIPIVHKHDQQAFLDAVLRAYLSPPVAIENLPFAIEWFTMSSPYPESGLISAMTVLENLIDSNLKDEDKRLLSDKQFEQLRSKLSKTVKEQLKEWTMTEPEHSDLLREINERFVELKRHTLLRKLKTLTARWQVSLEGLEDGAVTAAKKARDSVVHRGHYSSTDKHDLEHHRLIVRELVARIILTAIGFQGNYCTYLGGYQRRAFPVLLDTQVTR